MEVPTLATIGKGGLAEDFEDALETLAYDIADVNTQTNAREIKIVVKLTPETDREQVRVSWQIDLKRGKRIPGGDVFYVGRGQDGAVGTKALYRHDPKQLTFADTVREETGVEE